MFVFLLMECIILSFIVYLVFYMISYSVYYDSESLSGYECGFEVNSTSRVMFSYRFFLIAILFLVFDVEIVLMLPTPFVHLGKFYFLFLIVLILGLLYEYFYGSLDWMDVSKA